MSELREILVDTANRLMANAGGWSLCAQVERGEWPEAIWSQLTEMGLPQALVDPEAGLTASDVLPLVELCGYHALPLPLPETLVGNRLLNAAGLATGEAPCSLAEDVGEPPRLTRDGDLWRLRGALRRVPWGRHVDNVILLADTDHRPALVNLPARSLPWRHDISLAGEPRDSVFLDDHPVDPAHFAAYPRSQFQPHLWGALIRSLQMAGALRRVLELSVQYANEREQFGRPIARFQAIQQQLAAAAGQVAAASAAAEFAARQIATDNARFSVAVAKARVGEAAGQVAAVGHQVHGAMGYTQEHRLHNSTRRLWSWRDEFGNEAYWQDYLGGLAAGWGRDGLWPALTARQL